MPRIEENIIIAEYLSKYMSGECSREEEEIVIEWLENSNNRKKYETLKNQDAEDVFEEFNIDCSDIKLAVYNEIRKKRKTTYLKASSWMLLLTVIFSIPFLFYKISELKSLKTENLSQLVNSPDLDNVILYTSSGDKIWMDKSFTSKQILEENGSILNLNGNTIEYDTNTRISPKLIYNTIKVPHNGEFNLTLSDGTKVWLNANTKLKYPVHFKGKKREIFLEGEAYLKVARNEKKPFIVNTGKSSVKVLGTEFNVRNYKAHPIATTLVSGKVEICDEKNNKVVLKPNQQGIITTKGINVKNVEVAYYISWKDGFFTYDNVELDVILEELSDWYGFEYFYQNKKAKDYLFTARLKKYEDIRTILRILESTGRVKFTRKNNSITVSSKK